MKVSSYAVLYTQSVRSRLEQEKSHCHVTSLLSRARRSPGLANMNDPDIIKSLLLLVVYIYDSTPKHFTLQKLQKLRFLSLEFCVCHPQAQPLHVTVHPRLADHLHPAGPSRAHRREPDKTRLALAHQCTGAASRPGPTLRRTLQAELSRV